MAAQDLTYSWTASSDLGDLSSESGRSLLRQLETELYSSATYEQAIARLQTLPAELEAQVKQLLRAIAQEAMRLTCRKLVRPPQPVPTAAPIRQLPESSAPVLEAAATPAPPDVTAAPIPATAPPKRLPGRKRLTRKQLAAQAMQQAWETRLREVGQELRQVRQAKRLSLHHLHLRTQIPLHQLEALETGTIERLPEAVYIRGFIRQVGNALGINGLQLVESLPSLDPVQAILPTWHRPIEPVSGLRSVHLYLGYAAVMAGGLTWLSHQALPKVVPAAPTSQTPDAPRSQAPTTPHASLKAGTPMAIAQPELQPL